MAIGWFKLCALLFLTSIHSVEATFVCDNGNYVNDSLVCDGYYDCGDRSDESYTACRSEGICDRFMTQEFQCQNGKCIDKFYSCDRIQDCSDGSDETWEVCCATKSNLQSFVNQTCEGWGCV